MAQCACAMKYISTANNFNQFKNLLPLRVQTVYQLDRCCAGRSINYLVLAVFPHYQQTDFKSVLTVTAILHIVLASKRQHASAFYKCQNSDSLLCECEYEYHKNYLGFQVSSRLFFNCLYDTIILEPTYNNDHYLLFVFLFICYFE